jgi:hypothetical protein
MEILAEASDIIRSAEEEIRQLMGRAALAGDYDALAKLTSWGKALSSLVVQPSSQGAHRLAVADVPQQAKTETREPLPDPAPTQKRGHRSTDGVPSGPRLQPKTAEPPSTEKVPRSARPPSPPRRKDLNKNSAKYPLFLRYGGDLVKIGWSKKLRAQYEHKSPKEVLDLLAATLANLGSDGRRFTMEQVLPHMNLNGLDVPTYQTYLCLAWLRDAGLLHQHGRQGYSVGTEGALSEQVNFRWQDLPLKQ